MMATMNSHSETMDVSANKMLASLPDADRLELAPKLQLIAHNANDVLYGPGDVLRYAYFPLRGVISLLAAMEDGKSVGITLVGREGLVDIEAIVGNQTASKLAVVQIPGYSLRIQTQFFQELFQRGGVVQKEVLRYICQLLSQISQTAACNRVHLLEQRLARWLIMIHDRVQQDEFPVTHEFLSQMLGTPRSEVTLAAGVLRKSPCIAYSHGKMTILDRPGLESVACECYRHDAGL